MAATAASLLKLARRHLGEDYVLGVKVPKANATWTGPWDCAEFASWCVYQMTNTLFGCTPGVRNPDIADAYSGYWMDDSRSKGKRISIDEASATPGAFLVRAPAAGLVGHVVISAGAGMTVEAHSSARGVIEGVVDGRRWSTGVLVPGIRVGPVEGHEVVPPKLLLRIKKPLMRGELIERVQRALQRRGFSPGEIDGAYGAQTAAAVQAFQVDRGLLPDGEVGSVTGKALGIRPWPEVLD
jgi:hypothetical protein